MPIVPKKHLFFCYKSLNCSSGAEKRIFRANTAEKPRIPAECGAADCMAQMVTSS